MRAHPYLGRAHASCFCGVYPAHDPIGERGIITSLAGKPPALSTGLLTQVTSTPIGNILSLYPVQIDPLTRLLIHLLTRLSINFPTYLAEGR